MCITTNNTINWIFMFAKTLLLTLFKENDPD